MARGSREGGKQNYALTVAKSHRMRTPMVVVPVPAEQPVKTRSYKSHVSLVDQPHSNYFRQLSTEAQQGPGPQAGGLLKRQNTAVKTAIQAAQ